MRRAQQGPSEEEVDAALQAEDDFGGWEADSNDSDETMLAAVLEMEARQKIESGERSQDSPQSLSSKDPRSVDESKINAVVDVASKRFCSQSNYDRLRHDPTNVGVSCKLSASKKLANELKAEEAPLASARTPVDILAQRFAELFTRSGATALSPPCRTVPDLARHRTVIHGVEVSFPFSSGPLQPQQLVMENVIRALSSRSHAVLESPTGTGKTAAVLCAALAWQQHRRDKDGQAPQLVFASRTHAQLRQAIAELRRLPYRPTMAVVGSRESGLCIHPELGRSDEEGSQANVRQSCRQARRNRACAFYEGLQAHGLADRTEERLRAGDAWDIEDLAKYGAMSSACPYYLAHTIARHAELVFSPYSYILDPSVRRNARSSTIDFRDCVVILDEAHNVESICREGGSLEIGIDQIHGILAGLRRLASNGGGHEFTPQLPVSNGASLRSEAKVSKKRQLGGFLMPDSDSGDVTRTLQSATSQAPDQARRHAISKNVSGSARLLIGLFERLMSCISSRHEIAIFAPHQGNLRDVNSLLKDVGLLSEPLLRLEVRGGAGCEDASHVPDSRLIAHGASMLYDTLYHDRDMSSVLDLAANYLTQLAFVCQAPGLYAACIDPSTKRKIAFWLIAVEPALAPVAQSTHSMILMSGTLTPIEGSVAELGTSFVQRALAPLEVGHVIERHALTLVAVGNAEGTKLECTFRSWKREQFLNAIGKAILRICRSIPGGVLIFLPSYELLERCRQSWQQQSSGKKKQGPVQRITESAGERIWDALLAEKRSIVIEPPPLDTASQMQAQAAYAKAKQQYENAVEHDGHAILLAVYRGRMSEGVSFDNDFARGVICVGIPFPNLTEERLKQKRMCNDFWVRQGLGTVSGDAWYESRAFQAVAQALGRCIRHPGDYGSLILLDSRWVELGKFASLPAWLRPFVVEKTDASAAAEHLMAHFSAIHSCKTENGPISGHEHTSPRQFGSLSDQQLSDCNASAKEAIDIKQRTNSKAVFPGMKSRGVWQKTLKLPCKGSSDTETRCIDLD